MRHRIFRIAAFVLPAVACAPPSPSSAPGPDRIMAIDRDGTVIRASTADEHFRVTYDAPKTRVWRALMVSYAELGIDPTVADFTIGRYGNEAFVVPRRFIGRPIGEIFRCGSGITGPIVDRGRVIADVITTISPATDSTTLAFTHVGARVYSNDGASSDPIFCPSSGVIEEQLQAAMARNLKAVK